MSYPINNLFRPPVELVSAVTSLGAAVMLTTTASTLGVSPSITIGGCSVLLAMATARTHQALRVLRFQRNLRVLPTYRVTSDDIPWSEEEMFLGMGFWWEAHHTQLLYMARWPQHRPRWPRHRPRWKLNVHVGLLIRMVGSEGRI
jgi:conjugal transfer pilus assembly protein TraD